MVSSSPSSVSPPLASGKACANPGFEQVEIEWQTRVQSFLILGGWLNLVLCLLNLIPVPPLDGSRILASCSWKIRSSTGTHRPVVRTLLFLVILGGIADEPWRTSWGLSIRGGGRQSFS